MDSNILLWLGLLGFWLLRRLSRKRRSDSKARQLPRTQQTASGPGPGELVSRPASAPEPGLGHPRRRAEESEFDVALSEIRTTLGMGTPRRHDAQPPAPEVFGRSEEPFERRKPFAETRNLSEDPFEFRKSDSSTAWDAEERFEKKPRDWKAETTFNTSFDRQPAYSEVDFHDRFRDLADSPFKYRSAAEKKPERVKARPSKKAKSDLDSGREAPQPLKRSSIASRLKGRKSLGEAIVLAEILGPPASRRGPPASRRKT